MLWIKTVYVCREPQYAAADPKMNPPSQTGAWKRLKTADVDVSWLTLFSALSLVNIQSLKPSPLFASSPTTTLCRTFIALLCLCGTFILSSPTKASHFLLFFVSPVCGRQIPPLFLFGFLQGFCQISAMFVVFPRWGMRRESESVCASAAVCVGSISCPGGWKPPDYLCCAVCVCVADPLEASKGPAVCANSFWILVCLWHLCATLAARSGFFCVSLPKNPWVPLWCLHLTRVEAI